jgi:putative N6-adenine-specific DNA methylase
MSRHHNAGPSAWAAFAACQPGLEPFVAAELLALGAAPKVLAGGVAFAADNAMVMRAAYWLGCASHVLVRLAEFPCRALGELERKARDLPWSDWLRRTVPCAIRATAKGSRVYHTDAIAERIGNAIAATVGAMATSAARDVADELAADAADIARLTVRFRADVCTISLDATPTPLHRRGYRLASGKAPLREDLAHALVRASGFARGGALLDPFCGSGTIAIEAAGLALGLPPGRLRAVPLAHLALFDEPAWEAARRKPWGVDAETAGAEALGPIAAGDRDEGAIAMARDNAGRAGVGAAIAFTSGAFTAHPWLEAGGAPARGVVVCNPPFGRRVATGKNLLHLYQSLGHRVRGLGDGWRAALLAQDLRLARRTGLELRAAFTTRHGGIAVTGLVTGPAD